MRNYILVRSEERRCKNPLREFLIYLPSLVIYLPPLINFEKLPTAIFLPQLSAAGRDHSLPLRGRPLSTLSELPTAVPRPLLFKLSTLSGLATRDPRPLFFTLPLSLRLRLFPPARISPPTRSTPRSSRMTSSRCRPRRDAACSPSRRSCKWSLNRSICRGK